MLSSNKLLCNSRIALRDSCWLVSSTQKHSSNFNCKQEVQSYRYSIKITSDWGEKTIRCCFMKHSIRPMCNQAFSSDILEVKLTTFY